MVLKTRIIFNRLIVKAKGAICRSAPGFDYIWRVRDQSLRSCIGYLTLVGGMANYACSSAYIYLYMAYTGAVAKNNLNSTQCEIASAWAIMSYCTLF